MRDPKVARVMGDGSGVNLRNIVEVVMGDLSEKDQKDLKLELQCEMEVVMAERHMKKQLACFQKARHRLIKKGDTVKASALVNSPFTQEGVVHLVNVSVNSKYRADLHGVTHTLMDSVKGSVESLRLEFKRESEKMLWQIRSMVQQVLGESRGKCHTEGPNANTAAVGASSTTTLETHHNPGRVFNQGGNTSLNFQQPYYQVHDYGPGNQPVSDAFFPRPQATPLAAGDAYPGMSKNVRE
jgi:hypothetical protein